ncbi:Hypothetical protein CAP_1216 [Chondromyces apiculatus DSM 436]|uniref:Uncharacterized protein n=1 Tax=Chondromyces apiculatus DSM 436 TaxID=1192034 RepID=A0A017TDG4_9BACT|nr:Hypothetical protein CAP_1216 [Chondromyces apiculatus DSM 436]
MSLPRRAMVGEGEAEDVGRWAMLWTNRRGWGMPWTGSSDLSR